MPNTFDHTLLIIMYYISTNFVNQQSVVSATAKSVHDLLLHWSLAYEYICNFKTCMRSGNYYMLYTNQ